MDEHVIRTYARAEEVFVSGQGAVLRDADGREYLDMLGGIAVSALGHAHPELVAALRQQVGEVLHTSNLYRHPHTEAVAGLIADLTGLDAVFFTNSGAEATEAALKIARKHQRQTGAADRTGFVALEGGFHGRTLGALSVTHTPAYRAPFEPLVPGTQFVPPGDVAALESALANHPAALILEPIQGESGVVELPTNYLQTARALCSSTGTVLIHDEVQCGSGRTGTFLAADHADVQPDIVTLAKPIAAGLPMGMAVVRSELAGALVPGDHGSTFAGGPLACRAGVGVLAGSAERPSGERPRARPATPRRPRAAGLGVRPHHRAAWPRPHAGPAPPLRRTRAAEDPAPPRRPRQLHRRRRAALPPPLRDHTRTDRPGPRPPPHRSARARGAPRMTSHDFGRLPTKDLLSVASLSADDILRIFDSAQKLKVGRAEHTDVLRHKRLALIFEKDSLRTRFTFDVGIQDLGGSAVFMDHRDAKLGSRESLRDMARNLERWVHGIVARTFKQKAVEELAANCDVPVINGLSDFLHPCQALSDFFTLTEKWGDVRGRRLCFVGDGNNTCHSLVYVAAKLGAHMAVCTPQGYEPNAKVVNEAMIMGRDSGAEIRILNDPKEATEDADAVYTDVWASMGQEDEIEDRAAVFADYQVDDAMMSRAKADAYFMHCLPAHRGAEVTAGVMDGPHSIVLRHRREPPARTEGPPRDAHGEHNIMTDKVVLAYSGGLDTSIIIPWLQENHGLEVHAYAGDVGQGEDELTGLEDKASATGAASCRVADLRAEFLTDYVWPCLRAMAVYEGRYLLGTSMARPVLAKGQVEYAREVGARYVAHGCTGKGNDQVRFELAYMALQPDLEIIAPWRDWDIESREDALAYAAERNIPVTASVEKIYSRDRNLWHMSHEGGTLEDPGQPPPDNVWVTTIDPKAAPDEAITVTIEYEAGVPVGVDGARLSPVELVTKLNELGGQHGVGRVDICENRLVGMKSRGLYETPGGTIILEGLMALRAITLERDTARQAEKLMPEYCDLVYSGRWFHPLREAMDAFFSEVCKPVTGQVVVELYKGTAKALCAESAHSLYSEDLATFGKSASFDHADSRGFVKLYGLPGTVAARARRETGV